jgi:hypothetical protein
MLLRFTGRRFANLAQVYPEQSGPWLPGEVRDLPEPVALALLEVLGDCLEVVQPEPTTEPDEPDEANHG